MTDNRGRHNKGKAQGRGVTLPNSVKFKPSGMKLVDDWNKLSAAERSAWGWNFQNYKEAMKNG